jgi:hypothetical protein
MVAPWKDGRSPSENHGCRLDVDVWWPRGIHNLKEGILARRFSETDLSNLLNSLNLTELIKKSSPAAYLIIAIFNSSEPE